MYWCNCSESWLAKGRELCRTFRVRGWVTFHQVEIKKADETCVHCGYYALFSKTDPNETERHVLSDKWQALKA